MSPQSNNNNNNNNNLHENTILINQLQHQHLPKDVTDPFNLMESLVIGAACSVVFLYLNIYFRERYNKPLKNDEYGARVISLIHAVIAVIGCGYALLDHTGGFFDSVHATRLEADFSMFSFSYFLVDTVIMILWKFDTTYFLHHVVTLSFCGYCALGGKYGFATCFATWGGEVTNPLMHARWLLHANLQQQRHQQQQQLEQMSPPPPQNTTMIIRFLTISWFVLFFIFRFFGAPLVVYYMVTLMPFYFAPLCIGIMVMSWKFFFDVLRIEMMGEWWTG